MNKCKIGLVGIGGMGDAHLSFLRTMEDRGRAELCAVCDRDLDRYAINLEKHAFDSKTIHQYSDFDRFLESGEKLDLVVLSTPIHLHKGMFCKTVKAGYNVLLEKPPAVTIQDLDEMIAVLKKTKVLGAVGFQHTAEKSFLVFQQKLEQGVIGDVSSIRAQGIWRRYRDYFTRTPWAGKLKVGEHYVLDGTVNNPFAHLLNNSLLLAQTGGRSAEPLQVRAELYHANPIESEDTSCVKVLTRGGVDILFAATIAASDEEAPFIQVIGSEGVGYWDYEGNIRFAREDEEPFETLRVECDAPLDMYESVFDYLTGKSGKVCCALQDTRNFVLTGNLAFESSGLTHEIDRQYLTVTKENDREFISILGINQLIHEAVQENRLYSECGVRWGVCAKPMSSQGYKEFRL